MKIIILDPYLTGSHKQWALGYKKYSKHEVKILSMKGQFGKWRMYVGAVTLAKQFKKKNYMQNMSEWHNSLRTNLECLIYAKNFG